MLQKTKPFSFFFVTGMHCVHIAAERNDTEILGCLVKLGADINARVSNRFLFFRLSRKNEFRKPFFCKTT